MFGLPAGSEIIVLLVVVLLLFGGSRLAGMGKGAGRAIREFKDEVKGDPKSIDQATGETTTEAKAPEKTVDSPSPEQRAKEN